MNGKVDTTVELEDQTLDAVAGGITDGTSNTLMIGESPGDTASVTDGTSNTVLVTSKSKAKVTIPDLKRA